MPKKKNITVNSPVTDVRKLTPKKKAAFERLKLETVKDCIFNFPTRYEDRSTVTPIQYLESDQIQNIEATVVEIKNKKTKRRYLTITEAIVQDETGQLKIAWFRQPYLTKSLKPGTSAIFTGKVEFAYGNFQMTSPSYESNKANSLHTKRIIPIYKETKNITSKWLRFFTHPILKHISELEEIIPEETRKNQELITLHDALHNIHFPESKVKLIEAQNTLAYQEMLVLQASHEYTRKNLQSKKAYPIQFQKEKTIEIVKNLPFTLTNDQRKSAWQILQDLEKKTPMNRLLQGDVGSGKTVVAALAAASSALNSKQSMFLAPTEILAAQHFNSLQSILKTTKQTIALATRTQYKINNDESSKEEVQQLWNNGDIETIVGTHTLLQDEYTGSSIGLAIIDEQHRFGVKQREKIKSLKTGTKTPHFLSMTATPIPRTLALSMFGDLDFSNIKEMPKNRKPVKTKIVQSTKRNDAYRFIQEKINKGEQVFVVCPIIEESKNQERKSATEEYKKLNKIFPQNTIGLLHGKLPKEEKEQTLNDFKNKKSQILIATTVIEVGIDIPNATIMIIEDAERFGLAQLHQLRGRVGRNEKQAYCFLFSESQNEKTQERLMALETMNSGFELAQKDLELRGPGEALGIRQSGIPDLQMASLTDLDLIFMCKEEVKKLSEKSKTLEKFPQLQKAVLQKLKTAHLE